jgi:hypothetical protein
MKTNKPILVAIATMIVIYLLIAFVVWDINAHNWNIGARAIYVFWGTIFSILTYSGIKIDEK